MEPSLGTKTPDSKRAHANEYAPISFINSTLVPRVSHIHTLSSQGKLQDQQVGLTQAPETSLLLSLVSACTRACVYPLKVESLFPLVLWSPFSQTHWPSTPSYLGPSPLDATPPPLAWGASHGLRTLTPIRELLQYIYSAVCGSLTWGTWELLIL